MKAKIKVPYFHSSNGFYTNEKYSSVLTKIQSSNTKAEIKLRKAVWALGLRYRLNNRNIQGRPDLVFLSKKIAVFVDGTFWHGYKWDERKIKIKSNRAYWIPKIERNMQRDKENNRILKLQGWRVVRIWEHDINSNISKCLKKITKEIKSVK